MFLFWFPVCLAECRNCSLRGFRVEESLDSEGCCGFEAQLRSCRLQSCSPATKWSWLSCLRLLCAVVKHLCNALEQCSSIQKRNLHEITDAIVRAAFCLGCRVQARQPEIHYSPHAEASKLSLKSSKPRKLLLHPGFAWSATEPGGICLLGLSALPRSSMHQEIFYGNDRAWAEVSGPSVVSEDLQVV